MSIFGALDHVSPVQPAPLTITLVSAKLFLLSSLSWQLAIQMYR